MKKKTEQQKPDIPRVCRFCEHAVLINDEQNVLCNKKGIVNTSYYCHKYTYDPLKREPLTPPKMPTLSPEDIL